MMTLVSYDVSTVDAAGRKRLRKVAKECVNYGQRVQNSVFECALSPPELCLVREKLLTVMDKELDSIRIYHLGNNYQSKIEHFGAKQSYMPKDTFVF